jgi:Lysozyme like domain
VKVVLAAALALLLVPVAVVATIASALGGPAAPMPVTAHGAAGLAVAAAQAGFTGQGLRLAVAVGLAESGGSPTARGPNPPTPGCLTGSIDRGAWQLNDCYHPEVTDSCADDLACAASATYRISAAGTDWREWTTFESGAYQAQLATADQAIATLSQASALSSVPPGFGTPGPCGLSPATDYTKHLVTELFGITNIGGCAPFAGHIPDSDHYPDANGQAHAIDVMTGTDTQLGAQVAAWATAGAGPLQVKYVIFAGQMIDFRNPTPAWHACRDPSSSCAREHFDHIHISFLPGA